MIIKIINIAIHQFDFFNVMLVEEKFLQRGVEVIIDQPMDDNIIDRISLLSGMWDVRIPGVRRIRWIFQILNFLNFYKKIDLFLGRPVDRVFCFLSQKPVIFLFLFSHTIHHTVKQQRYPAPQQ